MHLKKNKLFRYFATVFFTTATIASIGFLGCSGVFLICTSLPLAVTVFLLSGAIEETVYGKSIYKGLGRLKLIGPKATQHFLKIELDNYLTKCDKDQLENDGFLKDYYLQRKYYRELKKKHSDFKDKNELKEAKKRLIELRNFFVAKIIKGNLNDYEMTYFGSDLASHSQIMLRKAKRRTWILSSLFAICVLFGIGSGLVTAASMYATLPALGLILSASTLSALVWPIALLAAVGAVFLLYKNMSDFFKENTVNKIKKLYKEIIQSRVKSTLGLIILSLTLFASVATACTWWVSVNAGLTLIPGIPVILVAVCCPLLIAFNFVTDLSFGVTTTAKTLRALFAIKRSELILNIKENFNALHQQESLTQLMNPFRIIIKSINIPFEILIFSAHVVSMGITTDRLWRLPPMLVAVGCAVPEALQDASFFVKEDDPNNNDGHDHDHGGIVMSILVWSKNLLLLASLIPIFSGIWHWLFKKEGNDLTFWNSIGDSIKQTCDIHEHKHNQTTIDSAPVLSKAWREQHRPELILSEAKRRLDSAKIDSKLAKKKGAYIGNLMQGRNEVVAYLTEGKGKDKSNAEAMEQYLKEKPKQETENGHTPNNGHITSVPANESGEKKYPSYDSVLSQRRSWSSCGFFNRASKQTTTSQMVKEAFNMVVPTAS